MNTITQHYDRETLLWEYACGALDEACALLASSYIAMCNDAKRCVQNFESIGGALLENECDSVPMSDGCLETVLSRIADDTATTESAIQAKTQKDRLAIKDSVPAPLQHYIEQCGRQVKWRAFMPGMAFCALPIENSTYSATLLKVAPGMKTPHHTHHGLEMTLVLDGAFEDETGYHDAGTLLIADDDLHHQPVATKDKACLCLVVSDAPVHFTGRFMSLLNFLNR